MPRPARATHKYMRPGARPGYFAGGVGAAGADEGAGAGAGVPGAGVAGRGAGAPLTTDAGPRCPMIDNTSAPSMNSTASTVVALVSTVAPVRAPNAAWLLPPPKALAMSPPLPCC